LGELPSSGAIGAVRARELLTEAASLRQVGRRPATLWPPLVIFGAVAVIDAPLSALGPLAALLWFAVAAPVAFAVVGRCSAVHARRRGVEGSARRMSVMGVASFLIGGLACFALIAATHLPVGLAWAIIMGVGYLAWSRLARSVPAALVAVALTAVGVCLALSPAPAWTVPLGVGTVMIAGGLALRRGPEAS
jgi:multidrug transporter EmrE-like cation transporter